MADTHDVVEQFVDGELVEPADLTRALADPAGREHLIDVLVLRALVGGRGPARLAVGRSAPHASRLRGLTAVAALAGICVIGGYLAGERRGHVAAGNLRVTPTAGEAGTIAAPEPTRVIRLENGVDWNEPERRGAR
jgi:hypothetical protein